MGVTYCLALFLTLPPLLMLGCGKGGKDKEQAGRTPVAAAQKQDAGPATVSDLKERLAELRYRRDKLRVVASRLDEDKRMILDRLTHDGKLTLDEVKKDKNWTIHAQELRDVLTELARAPGQIEAYDDVIIRLESYLRTLNRQEQMRSAGLSPDDRAKLSQIIHALDDRLHTASETKPVEAAELEALVERELQRQE